MRIPERADVAICGGGLAGLTLARQLRRELPELSVVVLDRLRRPLPEAAFKVGESTTETGSFYLAEVLGLREYLEHAHLAKLGFRFFFGDASGPFEERPEFGLVEFPQVGSYNLDRGVLENDLRRLNEEAGAVLVEGAAIERLELAEGAGPHRIAYRDPEGGERGLEAHWLVDASGRRRLLQRQLGLGRRTGRPCVAAWFRLEGRVDVEDLVPPDAAAWRARVPAGRRYWSTNHLMGPGYWVWLIPLPSGHTSIGIVALESLHAFLELNTFDKALGWLRKHEPALAAHLEGRAPLDFQCLRDYSYSSKRVYSEQRWACVGEAALFADPFYASATDLVGFGNCAATELIRLERQGRLTPARVAWFNRSLLGLNDSLTHNIQQGYPLFGDALVTSAKVIWDTATAWALLAPRMFNGLFTDPERSARVMKPSARSFFLTQRMQRLFQDWKAGSRQRHRFGFLEFLRVPALRDLRQRNLRTGKSEAELVADQVANMERLEELAQSLFLLAVEDVEPEALPQVRPPAWLDAWAVGLEPARWEADGLFRPRSAPRAKALEGQWRSLRELLGFPD